MTQEKLDKALAYVATLDTTMSKVEVAIFPEPEDVVLAETALPPKKSSIEKLLFEQRLGKWVLLTEYQVVPPLKG